MLGSALNEQGGGAGLYFLQEHGGIPPTPPFRRVLAGTDGIFGGDKLRKNKIHVSIVVRVRFNAHTYTIILWKVRTTNKLGIK